MKTHLIICEYTRDLQHHEDLRELQGASHVLLATQPHYWRGMIPDRVTVISIPRRFTRRELEQEIKITTSRCAAPTEVDWRC